MKTPITIQATINAPVEKVWKLWTEPEHITHWNFASPDWCAPAAENDLQAGGKFIFRMEACDGSEGFDFEGWYEEVKTNEFISYKLGDERRVQISFIQNGNTTDVAETFDLETVNSEELQRGGWQAILDNFKKYAESQS